MATGTVTQPTRAWSSTLPAGARTYRPPRVRPSINVECGSSPYMWEENPGVEFWSADIKLELVHPIPRELPTVVIATASLVRIDLNRYWDVGSALDGLSSDLAKIGEAILESEDKLSDWSVAGGMNTDIMIATDVVVDERWRGGGLGPALVHCAGELLRADVLFLSPSALGTRLSARGVTYSDYGFPRGGAPAQAKVRAAWRRGGFRALRGGVVWTPTSAEQVDRGRACLRRVEMVGSRTDNVAWVRRRAYRRLAVEQRAAEERRAH